MSIEVTFVFGQEPWLLPPAMELAHVLSCNEFKVKILYLEYKGRLEAPKGLRKFDVWCYPKALHESSIVRFCKPFVLRKELKKRSTKSSVIIACDPLSLQALPSFKKSKKTIYWHFEIIDRPTTVKISFDWLRSYLLARWIRTKAHLVLTPSATRALRLRARIINSIPVWTLYNTKRISSPRDDLSSDFKQFNVFDVKLVYSGSIGKGTYVDKIIEAFLALGPSIRACLILAGFIDPSYQSQFDKQLHYNPALKYLGVLPPEKLSSLLVLADIGFCLYDSTASKEASDPAPTKLGDYISSNTWIIASSQPYMIEIVQQNDLGVCIETANPNQITTGIESLINRKDFLIKEHIRRYHVEFFNMEYQSKELLSWIGN